MNGITILSIYIQHFIDEYQHQTGESVIPIVEWDPKIKDYIMYCSSKLISVEDCVKNVITGNYMRG